MFARRLATATLLLSFGLLAGCGRAPGTAVTLGEESAVPHMTLKADATAKKAVTVDGKVYAEGEAPAVFELPEAGTPAAGTGNVRAVIGIKGLGSFTKSMSLAIKQGDEGAFAKVWAADELKGIKVAAVASDLAPGEYEVQLSYFNKSNGMYNQKRKAIVVEADKAIDITF